ncbi:hypothetical protein [Hymenobacter sp. IS2118]|uniref:hypothetical protein n=1 Tax=Hymenobacter sp. IS2118 TaxID=1505605 RepID=UPI0005586C7A|nr:hypothetical protein [Hymenobacter sp. IS2118]
MLVEVEFPEEDAVFLMELFERMPNVRILPPKTSDEVMLREKIGAFRQQLYHSYGQIDPLQESKN